MKPMISSVAALLLACILTLLTASPAAAGGVVTDCTTFGPGPGTLATAVETDGLVTFACSGTITVTAEIPLPLPGRHLAVDGTGQAVLLSGGDQNRLFNVGPSSSLQLHNITLLHGNAGANGGGAISTAGVLTITNSALLSNTAAYGGALEIMNGSVFIQNSTLAGNQALDASAAGGGGAIDQYFAANYDDPNARSYEWPKVVIQNSTIVGNHSAAPNRHGIWQENGQLRLRYSLIANNGVRNCKIDAPNVAIQYFSTGNLDNDGSCAPAVQADPQLLPLGNYGGSTPTFALQPTSPAIDAGPATACAGVADQRGVLRPRDGNHDGAAACDLGAYEYGRRFLVAAANDDGLAGYWKFDEGGGAAVMDSTGGGRTAALAAGSSFTPDHPNVAFANAHALQSTPGAGARVEDAPPFNPQEELTVAAWVRLNSSSGVQPIVAKLADGGVGSGYGLFVRDGALSAETWDGSGSPHVITGSIPAGGWLHVAMTYKQGGNMAAYINGRRLDGLTVTTGLSVSPAPLQMGVDGALDDVRIYRRALPAGAIAALASGRGCVTGGTTWADAFSDLQCALGEAAAGNEVWVGPGVYRPARGPNRAATFAINEGVAVYGGFAGDETTRDQRKPATPRPVLSGDLEGNDRVDANGVITEPSGIAGGNALHVVTITGAQPLTPQPLTPQAATVLERVIVTGGQANGPAENGCTVACGGGIYVTGGAPQLRSLRLAGSYATDRGGSLYVSQSSTLLVASALLGSQATYGGGAYFGDARPQVVNTLFAGNYAAGDGGGAYAWNSPVRMVNVTAAGNRAGGSGGGLLLGEGSSLNNALLSGNAALNGEQIAGIAAVQHSLVQGGCGAGVTCSDNVQMVDPLFVQAVPPALAPTSLGNYHVQPISPAIDQGNNDAGFDPSLPEGATIAAVAVDLADAPRIVAARARPPRIDLGAYEEPNAPPVFLTAAVTQGGINTTYTYEAVAEDPNHPGVRLPIEVVMKPEWLSFAMQASGAGRLSGTPTRRWFGNYDVVLRATDSLGGSGEQAFVLQVKLALNPVFMPQIRAPKK